MANKSLADESSSKRAWQHEARKSTARWNVAWWLDRAGPLLVIASFIGAGILLYLRSQDPEIGFLSTWPWIVGGVAVVMTIALALAKAQFASNEASLVRLESHMQLNNALTAATRGVRPWPAPIAKVDDGIQWNWTWIITPFLLAATLLAAAFLIPIEPEAEVVDARSQGPRGWEEIENTIQELEQNETIEPQSLEQLKEKLGNLKSQPKNEWFSHSSMEATDNLKHSLRDAASNMAENFEQAEESLSSMEKFGQEMSPKAREKAMEEFKDAVEELKSGELKPNKELMDQLSGIDPSEFEKQLTPDQLEQLKDNLKKNQQAAENASGKNGEAGGQGEGPLSDEESDLMSLLDDEGNMKKKGNKGSGSGQNRDPGDGQPGNNQPGGKGGPGEGGRPSDLTLSDKPTDLGTKNLEGVKSKDISRALPADLVKIGKGQHDIDKTKIGPREAGTVKSTGEGGEAVWKDSLLPSEKRALKRYFK
jgi:hypothetical protein